jgi:hypothetical protein
MRRAAEAPVEPARPSFANEGGIWQVFGFEMIAKGGAWGGDG